VSRLSLRSKPSRFRLGQAPIPLYVAVFAVA
jgi:hypothetical protein